jgi:YgiT-type zinc finger domain-containing protein
LVGGFQNPENRMKCVICKTGEMYAGRATVILNREGATLVVKNVPADICDNCGEYYLSEEMTGRILALAEEAMHKGTEIEVLRWAA